MTRRLLLESAIKFFILVAVVAVLIWGVEKGIEKDEKIECKVLARLAKEKRAIFSITEWQKEQCDKYGIKIDAPIKRG